jgi:pimeloyl-ACP methyl ester carboxylesterase
MRGAVLSAGDLYCASVRRLELADSHHHGTWCTPTLITDGTADLLDPVANSHTLASLIHGARLTLYPDAGHGFLFQDQTALIPRIESFAG